MQAQVGQYALIRKDEDKKPILGLITKIANRKVYFDLEKLKPDVVSDEAPFENIVAVYDASAASEYGRDDHLFEAYYKSFNHELGEVHFFLKCSKEIKKRIETSLTLCGKKLQKKGLDRFFPVTFEIRPPKGKNGGMYTIHRNPEKLDTILIRLPNEEDENNTYDTNYVVMHEFGHGVFNRIFTRKERAAWVSLFRDKCSDMKITTKQINLVRKEIERGRVTIEDYVRTLKENDDQDSILILKESLKYMKDTYHITPRLINNLLEEGKSIAEYWPTFDVLKADFNVGPTDYAMKNPEEFWCENFAHYMLGMDISDDCRNLIKKTLKI